MSVWDIHLPPYPQISFLARFCPKVQLWRRLYREGYDPKVSMNPSFWLYFWYILTTYWLQFGYILPTCWLHSVTSWLPFGYTQVTFWLHFCYILVHFGYILLLSGYILASFWLHPRHTLAIFWLHCRHMLAIFWLHFGLHSMYLECSQKVFNMNHLY